MASDVFNDTVGVQINHGAGSFSADRSQIILVPVGGLGLITAHSISYQNINTTTGYYFEMTSVDPGSDPGSESIGIGLSPIDAINGQYMFNDGTVYNISDEVATFPISLPR